MGISLVIICLALFSTVIDGYIVTAPCDTITSIGERVELDCITNSSGSVTWRFKRYEGSDKVERISHDSQTRPNISESYRVLSKEVGQFILVIDPMLSQLAGRYECKDRDEEKPFVAEVTVLNETPSCNKESASYPSGKLVCRFIYAGNQMPGLEWLTPGSHSWSATCNATNYTVECIFESACTEQKQSANPNTFPTICMEEENLCEWKNSSDNYDSSVGFLRIKGSNITIGGWHCASTGDRSTAANPSSLFEVSTHAILLLICVGVTTTAIIILSVILHRKYGVCNKNRMTLDPLYDAETVDREDPVQTQTETEVEANDSVNMMSIYSLLGHIGEPENAPVYGQVQKKRKAGPKKSLNAHDNVICENSMYEFAKPFGEEKAVAEVSVNNFSTDGIIYAELRQVPGDTNGRLQEASVHVVSKEGFNTSIYASIDHHLRVPPLPPRSPSQNRRLN